LIGSTPVSSDHCATSAPAAPRFGNKICHNRTRALQLKSGRFNGSPSAICWTAFGAGFAGCRSRLARALPGGRKHANIYAQFGFSLGIPFKIGELVVHPNFVVSGLILVLALSSVSTVQGQVTMDASKITCDQFVHSKVAPTRTVAAWLSGFYNGKRDNRVIDLQSFEANLSKLENFCYEEKNYKLPVMQAVEKVIGRGK
jgi:acid stress chaperone HdeB